MASWRDIPASDVQWGDNPISRRAGMAVSRLCRKWGRSEPVSEFSTGAWSGLTLGQIADLGERHWLRMSDVGATAVEVIKWVIDEAAEGRCPTRIYEPYVPRIERNTPESRS